MKLRWLTFALVVTIAPGLPATAAQTDSTAVSADEECAAPALLLGTHPTDQATQLARIAGLTGHAPLESRTILRPSRNGKAELCLDQGVFPWADRLLSTATGPDFAIDVLPLDWLVHANTAYPRGRNLGALWAGRGVSTELRGGAEARWGPVSAGFAPRVIFQQNLSFQTIGRDNMPGYSTFVNPWHGKTIDWPQRFGTKPFWTIDPGQSFLRADAYGLGAGVSTENLWWGPALVHPIILSNNAPGFPHVFLETSNPVATRIGRFEGQIFWGRVAESDYWDDDPTNDRRLLTGLILTYEPRWLPGLFLGASRVYMETIPPEGLGFQGTFIDPYRSIRENQSKAVGGDNQIASIFARWAHPGSGFEVYLELARDDHWEDFKDLIMVPASSRGYTLGFQHVLETRRGWLRLYGEMINLQDPLPIRHSGRRGPIIYYTNSSVRQGYTHRGQILGAAVGPGTDAQTLGADLFTRKGSYGLFVERARYDADTYLTVWSRSYGPTRNHDLELTAGAHHLRFFSRFDLRSAVAYSYRQNRNFVGLNAAAPESGTEILEGNWEIQLELRWHPEARRLPAAAQIIPPDDG